MYVHTQRSPALLVLNLLGAVIPMGLLLSGKLDPEPFGVRLTVFVVMLIMLTTAFAFSSLTITVKDGQLDWRFGPGVLRKTVPIASIVSAEATTTSVFNGTGVHLTTRGWLYNISGRSAVSLMLSDGRRFLLGTDEPARLVEAIAMERHARR